MSHSHSALSNLNIIKCVQKVLYHFQDVVAISLTWTTGFFDHLSSSITYESKLDFCTVSVTPLFGIPSMILNASNLFFVLINIFLEERGKPS